MNWTIDTEGRKVQSDGWCDVFACRAKFDNGYDAKRHTMDTGHVTHLRVTTISDFTRVEAP